MRRRARAEPPPLTYNASGEYALIEAAGRNGWIDERRITLETLTGIKRAGANLIIGYHAKEVSQ